MEACNKEKKRKNKWSKAKTLVHKDMAYIRPKFIEQVFRLGIAVPKLGQQALIVLPCKIKGKKGKKESDTEKHPKASQYYFILFG